MPQLTLGNLLVASVIAAFVGLTGFVMAPVIVEPGTRMYLSPSDGLFEMGKTFEVMVKVDADTPVNVFSGLVQFDNQALHVEKIDYNISIADLWAVEPWYENGDGTLEFAGGTTRDGGFTGSDSIITITFKTIGTGDAHLKLTNARILQHNGLGTDVDLIDHPIDAIFSIAPEKLDEITVAKEPEQESYLLVVTKIPSTDLNDDGKQNFTDMSIFMTMFSSQNERADFNVDGKVNLVDLSIIMNK